MGDKNHSCVSVSRKKGEIWDPKEPTLEHKKIYMSTEKEDKGVSGVCSN